MLPKLFAYIFFTLSTITGNNPVLAQTSASPTLYNASPTDEIDKTACEEMQKLLDDKKRYFLISQSNDLETYKALSAKLVSITERALYTGYDNSVLKTDQISLDQQIKLFTTNSNKFIASLGTLRATVCGQDAAYTKASTTSHDLLALTRKTAGDIKKLYNDSIRKDILSLEKIQVIE